MPDPIDPANAIPQIADKPPVDVTPPPQLVVELAGYGLFRPYGTNGPADTEGLVLRLANVEPFCKLELINISAQPNACWGDNDQSLPANLGRALPSGRYGFHISSAEAAKLDIRPGDIIEVRQVDLAGNASTPTRIALSQANTNGFVDVGAFDGRTADNLGMKVGVSGYLLRNLSDTRPPKVLPDRMKIVPSATPGCGEVSGKRAIEPGATVWVLNTRTQKQFAGVVASDHTFIVKFEAEPGDPLNMAVADHNGVRTELGHTIYAPGAVKADPAGMVALKNFAE